MANLQLVPSPVQRPLSITAPEFLPKLSAFNDLTRDMRAAGVKVEAMSFLDDKIFIHPDSVELLSRRFGHEIRGARSRADGRYARNVVTIRQIDVIWFSPIKEQDK